ncbi:hypothetical protein D3C83_17660 [compost metagenome]
MIAPGEVAVDRGVARLQDELHLVAPGLAGRAGRRRKRDVLVLGVELGPELHRAVLRHCSVQRDRHLRAAALERGAPPRQHLGEVGQRHLGDLRLGQRVRLVAHERETHERHVGGAGVELDVAVPQPAFGVPENAMADDVHGRAGLLAQRDLLVGDPPPEIRGAGAMLG